MNHPLQCRCGTLKGHVSHTQSVSRGVCYCQDCQAFAHFLGKPADVLDEMGGTDVIATLQQNLTFTQGVEALACMSLTERGMLRWYARCCNTPIGNTPRDFRVSHVGVVHTCLHDAAASLPGGPSSLDGPFGPVRMRVNIKSAKGRPKAMPLSMIASVLRFLASLARARLDGSYRRTPFFDPTRGTPIVAPKVLGQNERQRVMDAVAAFRASPH